MTEGVTILHAKAAARAVDRTFGLIRIGDVLLALPAHSIREVIAGRPAYSPMPTKAEGLLGAVDIRGTIIAVLDLRPAFGRPQPERESHVIVIIRWQEHLIGLAADEVRGIAHVPDTDLCDLTTAGPNSNGTLASHTFQTGGKIYTVLDAQRIAELPHVPLAREKASNPRDGLSKTTESIVLFDCGTSRLGLDAICVDATVPSVKVERGVLTMGYCLGTIDHHGHDVPVVDTRAAIGLATTPRRPAETTVVVVRFSDKAMLGFAIDAVQDIVRVAPADILAMPMMEMDGASLFRGMLVDATGRQNLLLDVDRMRGHPELQRLAAFRKPRIRLQNPSKAAESVVAAADGAHMAPFLTYVTSEEHATLMSQVTEIIPYPPGLAPFDLGGSGMLGLFAHRGRVVPLVRLATVLGQTATFDPDQARVLIVETDGNTAGFVVDALLSIETANSHFAGSTAPGESAATSRDEDGLFRPLVMLGIGDRRRWVLHIDLIAEVARIYARSVREPETETRPPLRRPPLAAAG